MEPEIVMPTPLIKEEDISEDVVIDLDNYRSIEEVTEEWVNKIFEKFKCFFIADNHNLSKLMKWYIKSLKDDAVNVLNDDALKSFILRHINFFKLHFVEVGGCFADSYLDSLEDILSIYCNLEVKLLPKKLGNSKSYVKRYKRRISSIIHQLVVLAKHCLLDREERLLHVFMKMNVDKESEEATIFFNLLFLKFLAIDPKDKSDLAFCRAYILCQKWKKITEQEEWPKMDKMVYTAYEKTAVSINSNEILRSILLPQNDSVLDLITHKSNNPSVLCEAYFKYIRSESFHELDDLTHLEITDSDDEDFLPFDSHDDLDDGAFLKAYRTYVKSIKPVSTFYKNQSKQNDQDVTVEEISNLEDNECCIVSVGTSDVNPTDTQIVHELPDDDDISEIIYFIKKDPPSTRKKKKLSTSVDSTSSTSASTSIELVHRTARNKEHPICSDIKEGVTIETQTEVEFNHDSRQRGQQDIHKRFYEVLTPPSDQNIEENISELSVYTNIASPNVTELLTPHDRSMENITINDEVLFLNDPAKVSNDSQVVNNPVSPETSDSVGMLSSHTSTSGSNFISRQCTPTSRDITEVQNYTQQSKCNIPSSLSNNKRKDNLTKNINVHNTESDKFPELDVMKLDDSYKQKDPSTEKQTDLNVTFSSSTSTFTECVNHSTNVNQVNAVHENYVMNHAEISSPICSPLTKRVTIETQTESDFNCISQQARKEDLNKAFYGILTPPSDQNIEDNISNLSVYTEIVNPKNTDQNVVQKQSTDISTPENNCNSVNIVQNSPIENNLTTPHVSTESAGFFSLDASSNLGTNSLLQSCNKMKNNVTSNFHEIEPYISHTSSELSNIGNDNEGMSDHHMDGTSRESSMNSTDVTTSCKVGELPPVSEKQNEANSSLDADVSSDSPRLSTIPAKEQSNSMIVNKNNDLQGTEHSDFNHLNQQRNQQLVNQRIFGIFTPHSDQNVKENHLSVCNIIETNSINQRDRSKDISSTENATSKDSFVEINPNGLREDNIIESNTLFSAQASSIDIAPRDADCRESREILHSPKNIISSITNSVQEFEIVTVLDNAENTNQQMNNSTSDIIEDSSIKNNELNDKCMEAEEIVTENSQKNDTLFEKPKQPKVKELKVAIPNLDLAVTNVKEKINNNAEKKIMFTSPLKVTRTVLSDFCYFEDTLHKKWQQIRDTNTLDDFLCGPVEKINGLKNCLNLDKTFDIFDSSDCRASTPNITPNTTPTTSSTELTSPAYEEGLDDFRNFYDEKKNNVVSPSSSPHLDEIQIRKRSREDPEVINSNENAVVDVSISIPIKRKRIAIDETIREHHQSAIESVRKIMVPKHPPKGILKKFSSTYLAAKRNTAHILIPRNKICLASLDHYGVSPTDHQLQSKVCVVLEKISKHEITQWLRVSEISRKVRMEKEGYKWYAFECLHFKKNDTSNSRNGISQTNNMPGQSTSGTITQWRTPTGLYPSSFSNKNTVGLPTVYHQSTSLASKGMVDTTLTNNNDNFNNLSTICDGACCQHIVRNFSELQISIPTINSASTSTLRNPFRSIESGTDKTNVDAQENNAVIKFVPVSNIPKTAESVNNQISQLANLPIQYANNPLSQPSNDSMLLQPEEPKLELDGIVPESHKVPKPQRHDVPKPHLTNFSTIEPTLKAIPKPTVPTPQPTVVPELSEFEKILNMKTLTIPLDLQNLDLRRLSPSPVINSLNLQQVSPNSTFSADCLLNDLYPQNDSTIRKRFNRDFDMTHQDEHSYPIFVDTPVTTVCDKSLQNSLNSDHSAYIKIKRVCEKSLQDSQSAVTIVDVPSNKIVEKLRNDEKNNIPIDKYPSNQGSEIYLDSYDNPVDISLDRSCEITVQDEQNLTGSMDILLNKVWGEYHVQDELNSNTTVLIPTTSITEKHIPNKQNENLILYKSDRFSEKCLEGDQSCNKSQNKPSSEGCEVIPQHEQNCNLKVGKLLEGVSDKHMQMDHNCNTAFEVIPNKVCEEPNQYLNVDIPISGDSTDDSTLVPLNQVYNKPIKGKQRCLAPVEISSSKVCNISKNNNITIALQAKKSSDKHTRAKHRSETLDIPLNIIYERHLQLEHNIVPENHKQYEQSNNTLMEIPSNKTNEIPLNNGQDYNRVCENSLQSEHARSASIKIASNRTCQKPLHYNEAMDIKLKKIVDETLQDENDYNFAVAELPNRISDKNTQSKGNHNTDTEIPLNKVCDMSLPDTVLEKPFKALENYNLDVRTSSHCVAENIQQKQIYNKELPLNRVDEGQQCDNRVDGVKLDRACQELVDIEETYITSVDAKLSNRVCQKPLQDEQIHSTAVDTSYIKVRKNCLQNEQSFDTAVHIPLNRIYDIPRRVKQNQKTDSERLVHRESRKGLQSKRSYKKIDDSQSIVDNKSHPQLEQAIKLLSNSNYNNSPIDEKVYNSIANVSLEKDFDITDASVKTDCKFMEIDEIETHLPLKKRKLSVANCTDEDSDDDFLGPDLVEEIIKRARSEELQKDDISYPAKPMISIAEVQEKLTEHQQPRVFRTPAEKKEMPPPPPPPQASQVNFLETPKIITEQYNNHTYNNPTINYHMNNVPYTIFSCASIPYFPPIIVPMNSTTTFDMNIMSTPQEQQQHQQQTTTAPNRAHQSSSTQGTTTRSRRNKKSTEDREKTDAH